jgi:aspartate/tyrosine/aromatic aminotransferase
MQWEVLAPLFESKQFIAVFDFAYQGFDRSIDADREPIELFAAHNVPMLICSSFSKNMGLYGERVGACTVVASTPSQAASLQSHLKAHARCSYSNPVRHGPQLAAAVLNDPQLRAEWLEELDAMRRRIDQQRGHLLALIRERAPHLNFEFLAKQRGMFGFTGLAPDQVHQLREHYAIYLLNNGRINIAGLHADNIERFVDAIAAVTAVSSSHSASR